MTVKVCTNQFINTVIESHFWLILVLREIAACHKEERPFKMRKKSTQNSLLQGYPTEPLRKISALQAILELAGKFFTGTANRAGNLMLVKACWDL